MMNFMPVSKALGERNSNRYFTEVKKKQKRILDYLVIKDCELFGSLLFTFKHEFWKFLSFRKTYISL